jgi:putative transposase
VIDCHDRAIIGYELALRGRANEAERALEMACLARFGTLRPNGERPIIRSDNGLIFQSRRFRDACRFYRLPQECITPYTPEQNDLIERWFRSLKEACVWQQQFGTFQEAQHAIRAWIQWSQHGTPPSSLGLSESAAVCPAPWRRAARPARSVLARGVARARSSVARAPSASPRRSRATTVDEEGDWVV